jgi:hypothetical protein
MNAGTKKMYFHFSHILSVHLTHTFIVFLSAVSPHDLPLPVSSIISSDSTEMRGTFTLSFYTVPTPPTEC